MDPNKLECIRLAIQAGALKDDVLNLARKIEAYASPGEYPSSRRGTRRKESRGISGPNPSSPP